MNIGFHDFCTLVKCDSYIQHLISPRLNFLKRVFQLTGVISYLFPLKIYKISFSLTKIKPQEIDLPCGSLVLLFITLAL